MSDREEMAARTQATDSVSRQPRELRDMIKEIVKEVTPTILETAHDVATQAAKESCKRKNDDYEKLEEARRKRMNTTFTNEGNKQQYQHASEVMGVLEKIEAKLKNEEYEEATESLQQGKTLVMKRMKMIQLADKANWFAANEYSVGGIGSDDEDEKAIKKAITRANERSIKYEASYRSRHGEGEFSVGRSAHTRRRNIPETTKICFRCGFYGHTRETCFRRLGNNR